MFAKNGFKGGQQVAAGAQQNHAGINADESRSG